MAGALARGSRGVAEGDPEHPAIAPPSGQDPSAQLTGVGGVLHSMLPGDLEQLPCQVWSVPGLPVTHEAPPTAPCKPAQEGSFP